MSIVHIGSEKFKFELCKWLGYGSAFDNIETLQREVDSSVPPWTASFGDLDVSRDKIAGIDVMIYRPKDVSPGELLPGLVFFHGGGWITGDIDFYDRTAHNFANCTRKVTISVNYRLAPKYPFPVPLQDCFDVTSHVLKHGKKLGIDVNRVGVAGDSAGGNLAVAVGLKLRDEKESKLPPLKYQVLVYPAVQAHDFRLPSYLELGEIMLFPSSFGMAAYWAFYMGLDPTKIEKYAALMKDNHHVPPHLLTDSKYAKYLDLKNLPEKFRKPRPEVMENIATLKKPDETVSYDTELYDRIKETITNPLFAPLMADDLSGLPSTLLLIVEFDVLRDDGLLFAHRLREAGVKTDVYLSKGFHGEFLHLLPQYWHSKTGERSINAMCEFMKEHE
ncbi:arylacetamide deacetylase [Plakobranchus ocellatus]|uniref:Arylacetamide deacetylase n=1 Tax=Plakobranchus ocellatus TaxID=259542 RepID=A0AAV4AP86_9GAST|nr:arylacetamide deacetylase [Plakobranchus ocellatus]